MTLHPAAQVVRSIIAAITPYDEREAEDRHKALDWIDSGAPLWRTAKPATPPTHLVTYSVLVERGRSSEGISLLLVEHRRAGRWLPTGGHVEPGEHPAASARRELAEELGLTSAALLLDEPLLLTVTTTVGGDAGHQDVTLWYVFCYESDAPLRPDDREFSSWAWWPANAIGTESTTPFDPNLPRFLAKLERLPRR